MSFSLTAALLDQQISLLVHTADLPVYIRLLLPHLVILNAFLYILQVVLLEIGVSQGGSVG